MGDKTQILALILASRFKKPWTIMAGILVATVLNHLLAAVVGDYFSYIIPSEYLKLILALIFIGFAIWVLIPDKDDVPRGIQRYGAFITTLITFFIAEMGDKTQLSTLALAAQYKDLMLVTVGTTLGMLVADGLAVFLGERLTKTFPMKWIRFFTSILYLFFAAYLLLS